MLDGLRGEESIAELCRREGISQAIYYKWSKDFMEAGKLFGGAGNDSFIFNDGDGRDAIRDFDRLGEDHASKALG